MHTMISTKRAYDEPSENDGYRVLVDAMWPRGIKKEDAHINLWLRNIAPSKELRQWFGHDPKRWESFKKKYHLELEKNHIPVDLLMEIKRRRDTVTLVYAARDTEHNNALALKDYLKRM